MKTPKTLTSVFMKFTVTILLFFTIIVSFAECPPYFIPEIKTEANYSTVKYIDPTAGSGGNGSISSPLSSLPGTLQQNTAYLIKRGTTHPYISRKFNSVLIGAYGQGEKPIINGGLEVQNYSSNSTIRDLDIMRQRSSDWDKVLEFNHQNSSTNITVAYCKIRGVESGGRYPQYAIHHAVDGLILFNNEIYNIQNNGWWLTPHTDIKVIRNWFHDINKGGETATNSSGDGIQAEYGLNGFYFAGNLLDKSNAMWKYALMLNGEQHYNVMEYNTFYPPKAGAGGAGVRWVSQQGGIFRKNLVRSIDDNGNQLVVPFDTWDSHANKPEPYGIRDNHIMVVSGSGVSTNGVTLHSSNSVFYGISSYQTYINNNPSIGLYGSDINTDTFWNPPCDDTTPPQTYSVTFQVKCYHQGYDIENAVVTFNGVTQEVGNYTFNNVPQGTFGYSISAEGHNSSSATLAVSQDVVVPVLLTSDFFDISISASPSQGGTFAGNGSYMEGDNATVTAAPNQAYRFENWTENGNVVSNNAIYTFEVTRNRNLVANFSLNSFTLKYIPQGNGIITGSSTQTVEYGGSGSSVRAVPRLGYHFTSWSDGSVQNPRTDTNVIADKTIYATFSINTSSISADLNEYIRIYPNPVVNILNVGVSMNDVFNVTIINSQGQTVKQLSAASYGVNTYNVSDLSPGIYFISLSSSSRNVSRKFLKQ